MFYCHFHCIKSEFTVKINVFLPLYIRFLLPVGFTVILLGFRKRFHMQKSIDFAIAGSECAADLGDDWDTEALYD